MNEPSKLDSDIDGRYRTLIESALAAFARTTGISATLTADQPTPLADAAITVDAGNRRFDFIVEVKLNVDRRIALADAKDRVASYGAEGLLITRYITHALAKECREKLGLQFLDTAGNAYLKRDGLYVYVTGERRIAEPFDIPTVTPGTPAWLKIVFALLCRPELRSASYRELAKEARVALGTVGPVIGALEVRRDIAMNANRGARVLLAPARMLKEWADTYPDRLRPKLHKQRFRAERPDWWRNADLSEAGAYWGGEVAAAKLVGDLKPTTCTIYTAPERRRPTLQRLAWKYHLQADTEGNIEILDAFWNFPATEQANDSVPPILVYADLRATLDPRNLEVAKLVHQRYLNDSFGDDVFSPA